MESEQQGLLAPGGHQENNNGIQEISSNFWGMWPTKGPVLNDNEMQEFTFTIETINSFMKKLWIARFFVIMASIINVLGVFFLVTMNLLALFGVVPAYWFSSALGYFGGTIMVVVMSLILNVLQLQYIRRILKESSMHLKMNLVVNNFGFKWPVITIERSAATGPIESI